MLRYIKINGRKLKYSLRRRKRVKNLRLSIYSDGAFVVSAPKWYPVYVINRFLEEKAHWIYRRLKNLDLAALANKRILEKEKYQKNKAIARQIIQQRIDHFNQYYHFAFKRISIKNQKRCWGSASAKGNLNFNWKVAFLPDDLRDYIIVHELCHLKELNHSCRFWSLVEKTQSDFRSARKKLKQKSEIL